MSRAYCKLTSGKTRINEDETQRASDAASKYYKARLYDNNDVLSSM